MASTLSNRIKGLVEDWLKLDPNPATRKEIEDLVEQGNEKELEKRLGQRIAFGTAGLRGTMQAGFACMNDLTVIQAAQGLCVYLETTLEDLKTGGICVGWDARYNSKKWADFTAAIFVSKGVPVYKFSRLTATPIVPFTVLLKKCVAGVMVTASHNPKDDNGYKVYWANGCQIVSPHDAGIAQCIKENSVPWKLDYDTLLKSPLVIDPTEEVIKTYSKMASEAYCYHREDNKQSKFPIVFTPMHGVGKEWVAEIFKAFDLQPYIPVSQQIEPHPDFPTVPFPNPEEGKGALKLGMETAESHHSRLVIANDPDSDRLAVAEKQLDGTWKIFTGNEIGILLGHWAWTQYKEKHKDVDPSKCVVLNSTVSSKMLKSMADAENLYYEETLTGFKWLGNKADELMKKGYNFIFAFEEAIGFMVGSLCLDKDGVRGAAIFAEMANYLEKHSGLLCNAQLENLYKKYGYFATNNKYFFCYDPKVMETIFAKIRNGGKYTDSIGKYRVKNIRDLTTGYDTNQPDKKAILPVSSSTHMITFFFENGGVATLRGSGTEPKLKYYTDLKGEDPVQTRAVLSDMVQSIIDQLLEPEKNGLEKPRD